MNHSIGIDVGKAELVACIRASDGKTAIPAPFPNSIIGLKKLIVHFSKNNIGTDDPILLESTGPYHWKAARTLTDKGYLVKVANPLHTKEMARKKALVRHYWKLRLTATNHSIHERYLKEYRGIGTHSISDLILKKCEKLKQEIIDEWDKGNDVKYLDSIPGLTPFLAITILAELLPIQRFERIDQIIAYAGLDPSVKQTAGKKGAHGAISKRGSPSLREALFLAAFGSFSKQPMKTLYDRYKARGLHHNTILCIIGRKILRIAVSLLKKRRMFDPRKLSAVHHLTGT